MFIEFVGEDLFFIVYPLSNWQNVTSLLLPYHYFHRKCSFLKILPVQTFTARAQHATSMESNNSYFFYFPNIKRKFHSDSFSKELLLCGTDFCMDHSLNTTILTTSSQANSYLSPLFSQSLLLATPTFIPITLTSFIITILAVTLYIEWLLY